MKAVAFAAVVVFASAVNAQTGEQDVIDWNSSSRQAWNETSLREYLNTTEVYRAMLWTPFWGQALARVAVGTDGKANLVTKVLGTDKAIVTLSRALSDEELKGFLSSFNRSAFWTLPTNEVQDRHYKDADTCALEVVEHGNYHAVLRQIGPKSAFADACSFFAREALKQSSLRSTDVNCRYQALAQVCAVCSPFAGSMSVNGIFHQLSLS